MFTLLSSNGWCFSFRCECTAERTAESWMRSLCCAIHLWRDYRLHHSVGKAVYCYSTALKVDRRLQTNMFQALGHNESIWQRFACTLPQQSQLRSDSGENFLQFDLLREALCTTFSCIRLSWAQDEKRIHLITCQFIWDLMFKNGQIVLKKKVTNTKSEVNKKTT